jgi:hypothetical protein
MKEPYVRATSAIGAHNLFSRISNLFIREPESDHGTGVHYIIDMFGPSGGNDGARVIMTVCENLDIPVVDLRNQYVAPIRDIVNQILETSPPRCAVILDTRDNELFQKVRARIAAKHCDLRYRRIICCLVDQEVPLAPSTPTANQIYVPGSIDDKMTMLLYHIPGQIHTLSTSIEDFRPLAEMMTDYGLFEPRVWREVDVSGTMAKFLSTAMYQIARRVKNNPCIGDTYPSFEVGWRRTLAMQLNSSLPTAPIALCPSIHRVIPIGVSPSDALKAMQVAIPKDLPDPYVVTVQSSAVNDRCGSIAIAQPMNYTVVHISCMLDPVILVEVCRELRIGHKAMVAEVQEIRQDMTTQLNTMRRETSTMRLETNQKLTIMTKLVTKLMKQDSKSDPYDDNSIACAKRGCINVVKGRFSSGKRRRQCEGCLAHVTKSKKVSRSETF